MAGSLGWHCWAAPAVQAAEDRTRALEQHREQVMRIFISHVKEDSQIAEILARAIADRGHEVIARDGGAGALDRAEAMIVLVSPQSAESPFVRREIEFALASPRFAKRLIPVVIAETNDAPWILRKLPSFAAGSDLVQTGRRVVEALEKTA